MFPPARLLLATLALAVVCPLAVAADYTLHPHWIQSHLADEQREVTSVTTIEVFGEPYILATVPTRGLAFFRPLADGLELVNDFALGGREIDAAVDGWNVYVAGDGLNPLLSRVLVASVESPLVLWQSNLPGEPRAVRLHDHLALLPCGEDGLLVFDLTEVLGIPTGVVGQWNGIARDAIMVSDLLYVLSPTGLHVLDLADPTAPTELAFLALPGSWVLDRHQGRLVAGGGGSDLWVIDVSDPLSPQHEMTVPGEQPAVDLVSTGDELYVADRWRYRVLGPDFELRWLAPARMDENTCLAVAHDLMLMGTEERGLHVFADGLHASAQPVPSLDMDVYNPLPRQLLGDTLYVTSGRYTHAYHVGDATPYLLWSHLSPDQFAGPKAVHVAGGRAHIGYSTGVVEVLDVTGPSPELLGDILLGPDGEVIDLVWTGSVLAVLWNSDGWSGFLGDQVLTLDLAVPAEPVVLDSLDVVYQMSIHAVGDVLAVWSRADSGLSVDLIDASDPTDLRPAASHPKPPFSRVTPGGEYLYVSDDTTLQVLRIESADQIVAGPVQPVPIDTPHHRFHRVGDVGYLSQADLLYDLADPLVPRPVGSFSNLTVSEAYSVFASAEHLVPVDGRIIYLLPPQDSDLTPVPDERPVPAPATATQLLAAPNPFNPIVSLSFTAPRPGPAWLEVFDARGRRVLERQLSLPAAGEHAVVWDGRDRNGRATPSGTYLARVRGEGLHAVAKVMLAK